LNHSNNHYTVRYAQERPPNTPMQPTPLRGEQDRGDFGSRMRLERFPDLSVAAQLMGNPLGAPTQTSSRAQCAIGTTNNQVGNRVYNTDTKSRRPDKKEAY
jgi:hypothetical protein